MIIGIDLGTTNTTLAFIKDENSSVESFAISQQCETGFFEEKPQLPSFYYIPLEEEKFDPLVGHFAKERGKELPDRVIFSAKSWLCHKGRDRRAAFLPLGDLPNKKSPVEVNAEFLKHLKLQWEEKFSLRFADQSVLVTVPASFDPSAKELIADAAALAGYPEVVLIEEPLAAFYAWIDKHENNWRDLLKVGDRVLVIDIGGGTTDFSMIAVEEENGSLKLERKAVGDHLLLGGDNVDLTLAYFAMQQLQEELDFIQFQNLVHRCREAKEVLLGENPPKNYEIVLQGRGTSLIGGLKTIQLTREEVEKLLIDGFFPFASFDQKPSQVASGIQEMGLPYAKDPRITVQLAAFLNRCSLPSKVLLNGGTMKAHAFKTRLMEVLSSWTQEKVELLENADLDFAVSAGAAYYGRIRQGQGIRVRAGLSQNYFIGIESAMPSVPGISLPVKPLCIAPFGMEEGSEATLGGRQFHLLMGQKAEFRFFSSKKEGIELGKYVLASEVEELATIEAKLESNDAEENLVSVKLESKVTELGMLELWFRNEDGKKWKLEFNVREALRESNQTF